MMYSSTVLYAAVQCFGRSEIPLTYMGRPQTIFRVQLLCSKWMVNECGTEIMLSSKFSLIGQVQQDSLDQVQRATESCGKPETAPLKGWPLNTHCAANQVRSRDVELAREVGGVSEARCRTLPQSMLSGASWCMGEGGVASAARFVLAARRVVRPAAGESGCCRSWQWRGGSQ